MANLTINNILNEYVKNNNILNPIDNLDFSTYDSYQKSLYSFVLQEGKTSKGIAKTISTTNTPLNNINFHKGISLGINSADNGDLGNFKESAFYLISSLYVKDINTFVSDKSKLTVLFKSGIGITDLPYSVVLYLGGLHHFHKLNTNNRLLDDWTAYPNELDGSESFNLKIGSKLSTVYGGENKNNSKVILQSLPIITDTMYRGDTIKPGSFIPNFGYGTYSNYLKDYHNFMVDNQGKLNQIDIGKELFHQYGAKNGFVKSFKAYRGGINFMGHYTTLKNKYSFTNLNIEDIKKYIKANIFDGLSNSDVYQMYLVFSKIKVGYLYGKFGLADIQDIIEFINDRFSKLSFSAQLRPGFPPIKIGYFSYLIYGYFFNRANNINTISIPGGTNIQMDIIFDNINKLFLDVIPNGFFNDVSEKNEATYLRSFLLYFWDLEVKYYEQSEFIGGQDPFFVLLYPSSGGVFYPNNIIPKKSEFIGENMFDKKEFTSFVNFYKRSKHINEYLPTDYSSNDIVFDSRGNAAKILKEPVGLNSLTTEKVYLYHDSMLDVNFDNKSVIENATRLLWYDTAHGGLQLGTLDNLNKNSVNESVNSTLISALTDGVLPVNYFSEIYKQNAGYTDITKYKDNSRLKLYDLYNIIDIEKFEAFEQAFLEFATSAKSYSLTHTGNVFSKNNDNHTFETFLKGVSTIGDSDIDILGIDQVVSIEDSVLLLLGYSSYNYYFCDQYGISAKINAILTQAQYNKNSKLFKDFGGQKLPLNNYSTVGSVSLSDDKTKKIYYDNFIFRPDVLFISDIKDKVSKDTKYVKYYTRKLIFGDTLIKPYRLNTDDLKIIINKYFYDGVDINSVYPYSRLLINVFFYLNVDLTEDNVVLMYNLLNDLLRNIIKSNKGKATKEIQGVINHVDFDLLNNNELLPALNQLFDLKILSNEELGDQISDYFKNFIIDFYDQNILGLNNYIDGIKMKLDNLTKLDVKDPNSLISKLHIKNSVDELKTKTYYNIKNLYDKYISYQPKIIHTYPENYADVNIDNELDLNNGSLFYNFLFKDADVVDPKNMGDSVSSIFNPQMPKHLIEYINIVDRANNNIGGDILIDVLSLGESLELKFNSVSNQINNEINTEITSKSVYSLFSEIAIKNDFLLHPMNSYVDYLSPFSDVNNNIDQYAHNLFGLHTTTERIDSNPSFILQWINHTSSFDTKINGSSNVSLTNSFPLDIDVSKKPYTLANSLYVPDDIKSGNVTAFVVEFGNKNQGMFSNVKLDTSQFANTEESINAFINLVNQDAKGAQTIASGNLFSLMENRSYTCQVESMGNAMIQPLTYFYLKNVPLFSGSYWITNVDHTITPNNMVTTFKGTRQPFARKTNNKADIIRQMADTIAKLTAPASIDQSNDYTIGAIKQNRGDISSNPYGTFYQMSKKSSNMVAYQGNQILYSFLTKYFPANSEIYKLVLMVLYNRAKRFAYLDYNSNSISPSIVITYMVDMALNLRANSLSYENDLYFDVTKDHSLTDLLRDSPVNQEHDIWKTITKLSTAKSMDDIIKILKPKALTSQKLIITDINGNYNNGNLIFNTTTKTSPRISFTENQVSDFSDFWRVYDILYMKYIPTDPNGDNTIYNTNINNYINIKEYQYLNMLAKPNLSSGVKNDNNIYLGCYDKTNGISFFGYVKDSNTTQENYGIDLISNEVLLSGYTPITPTESGTLVPISQRILNRYNRVENENPGFQVKVKEIALNIGVNELDLIRVIYAESGIRSKAQFGDGGKDKPYTTNRASSATGLIQFLESTAKKLGTTTQKLYNMTSIEQLNYVGKYFQMNGFSSGVKKQIYDIYAAVFYPVLVGKPNDYILGSLTVPYDSDNSAFKIADNNSVISKYSKRLVDNKKVIDVAAFKVYVNNLS